MPHTCHDSLEVQDFPGTATVTLKSAAECPDAASSLECHAHGARDTGFFQRFPLVRTDT